jgi:hypothetical protein
LKPACERKVSGGRVVKDTVFNRGKKRICPVKVPRYSPLVLVINVDEEKVRRSEWRRWSVVHLNNI